MRHPGPAGGRLASLPTSPRGALDTFRVQRCLERVVSPDRGLLVGNGVLERRRQRPATAFGRGDRPTITGQRTLLRRDSRSISSSDVRGHSPAAYPPVAKETFVQPGRYEAHVATVTRKP